MAASTPVPSDDNLNGVADSADTKKGIFIGDEGCGKTALIIRYVHKQIPDPGTPVIVKERPAEVILDGKRTVLMAWEIASQESYSAIRTLVYQDTDVVVLCYAIDDPKSLDNAVEKWLPEVRQYLPDVPVILVGNKMDIRSDQEVVDELSAKSLAPVTVSQGLEKSQAASARRHLECSAKTGEGVTDVFVAAVSEIAK